MLSQEIRQQFLQYFQKQQHVLVPSSPVIPHDDPTLLFTNAGMNQFKDVFLGQNKRDYVRAASSQKCIRAGGKHNDLENVGHTRRHLTLFEMLGNFSFGDYFKTKAIEFAWHVSTEVFQLDPKRIWATVFREDDEAFELWKKYLPQERIVRFDEKDNFWAMGDTGPCGPCSELLYDRGQAYGSARTPLEDPSGEKFLEFWNLVFMQYNRDAEGTMRPLAKQSIDTGAGLERIAMLKLDTDHVFATDILRGLIAQVENVSSMHYHRNDALAPAFHVIADHIRTLAFAIADGAQPSNIERGYVLRKILRRAVRYGRMLGMQEPFLAKVYPRLIELMGQDYPELKSAQNRIEEILNIEEESFFRTLRRGGSMLQQIIADAQTNQHPISGSDAFKLKDTYGLPLEEITLLAKDNNLTVDLAQYETLQTQAKELSRSAHKTTHQIASASVFQQLQQQMETHCLFVGNNQHQVETKVIGIVHGDQIVEQLSSGEKGAIILERTPFYAEMGGQVGDTGLLINTDWECDVTDCVSPCTGVIAHMVFVSRGTVRVGDSVHATIDTTRRTMIANNHTATHLLNWALCTLLGDHVKQAGSVVEADRLRFDFSHHKHLSKEQINQIEDLINERIRRNTPVSWYEKEYADVQGKADVKQFFGDKYGSIVRIVDTGFSKELCGGSHTSTLGTIGLFRIAKESSIAAGVRRIEAVTGKEAESFMQVQEELLHQAADLLKCTPMQINERLRQLQEENKQIASDLKQIKQQQLQMEADNLLKHAEQIGSVQLIATEVSIAAADLRNFAQMLISKIPQGVVVLAAQEKPRCNLFVQMSPELVKKGWSAAQWITHLSPLIGGKGGGKADSAQAGGSDATKLAEVLQQCTILTHESLEKNKVV